MRGFDPKFRDIPDYIEQITREIWEERGIGRSLDKYYAKNIIVRASNAIITNSDGVAAATLATLHEFPDRQLIFEDCIWTGNDDDGYFSSHRLMSVMRKQNDGAYGPGAGQLVRSRIIADCVIDRGVITEEWLVRDHAAFATCLDTTAKALARDLVEADLATHGRVTVFTPDQDMAGSYLARIDESKEAVLYAAAWHEIWGAKSPAAIRATYHQGASVSVAGGEVLSGHNDIDRFVISYLACFPDAELIIDHLIVNRDAGQPVRLAMRWSINATHNGWGRFGAPSGARIYILGMTQAYLVDGRITMEWICTDEVAIWKQILRALSG